MYKRFPGEFGSQWFNAILAGVVVITFVRDAASADLWGGSVALTNDYLVRGISRSDHDPALQLDLHYLFDSGLIAGAFASNTRLDPRQSWTAELNGFLGFAWSASSDWRGKVLASYYGYVSNGSEPSYNYEEIDIDVGYRQWLSVSVSYSPAAPRFAPYVGFKRVSSSSVEVDVQRPVIGRLASTAGVGYDYFAGGPPSGFVYWSLGLAYDLSPFSLSVAYAETGASAKSLFFDDAARGRWIATVIRRF